MTTPDPNEPKIDNKIEAEQVNPSKENISNVDFLMMADEKTKNVKGTPLNFAQASEEEPELPANQSDPKPSSTTKSSESED